MLTIRCFIFLFSFLLMVPLPVAAENAAEEESAPMYSQAARRPAPMESAFPAVTAIDVSGLQRVEESTLLSFLGIKPGERVSADRIDAALASVYKSGLFSDVSIKMQKSSLVVKVVENPVINEVVFEGNKRIEDEALRKEITSVPRGIYSKTDVQHDVKRILDIYQKSGRFLATVTPKTVGLSQNRVNVVFEIDEGDRARIARIAFVGNNAFGDSRLRQVIQTRETRWYRFFSSDDTYDPDRLAFDQELLRRFYVSHGHADFHVLSAVAELTREKDAFLITFTVDEGKVYEFGDIGVESRLPDLDIEQLRQLVKIAPGARFNANEIEATVGEITKYLGNRGYAFVDISPQYDRDANAGRIGVNFIVKEGPRVYIDNINIHGNVRTLDEVIRREFRIAEGDPYNADKIKRSQQRIQDLGFFSNVDVKNQPGSAPDRVNVDVGVEEQSTGELTFGAGFSTSDGALGDISISERNLLGRGQFLKLNLTMASVRREIDLSFTEPYFMGKNFAAGFDLFKLKREGNSARTNRTFDIDSNGIVLRTAYPMTEYLTHSANYSLRTDDISDISPTASLFVRRQAGENTTSLIGHSLIFDKRDSKSNPAEGYFVRLNQDVAGLGGDAKFFRNELRGGYYHPLAQNWIVKLSAKGGHVFGLDDEDVRINDRFFIGGNDIRGFDNEGLGPRDQGTKDPLGGKTYVATSAELSFPLGLPQELGFLGSVFTDAGTLFGTDDSDTINPDGTVSRVLDEHSIRASAGVGLSWSSPLGPIRIDLAHAFQKEDFDDTEQLRFSFGTRF